MFLFAYKPGEMFAEVNLLLGFHSCLSHIGLFDVLCI